MDLRGVPQRVDNNSLDVSVLRGRFFHKEVMSTNNNDEIAKVVLLQSFRAMCGCQHLEWSRKKYCYVSSRPGGQKNAHPVASAFPFFFILFKPLYSW